MEDQSQAENDGEEVNDGTGKKDEKELRKL